MAERLCTWTVVLAILAMGTTACGGGGKALSGSPASTAAASVALNMQVIVNVAVAWQPEGELTAAAVVAQRARIEAAQDELVQALGVHGSLVRRLTETAQVVVAVDDAGRALLTGHRRAASVQENRPDAATGPATTTEPATSTTQPATATTAAPQTRRSTIVTLAVEWRPEIELAPSGVAEQRARIEAAQDELVRALADHGALTRRLTETAQLVVSADATGIAMLNGHPLVKAAQANSPVPPSSSN